MQVVWCLGAGPHHQLAVGILRGHRRVLLDRQVGASLEEEHIVEHVVGASDGRVHVAELERHRLVDVARVAVLVNARLGMRQAVVRAGVGAERLVLDVNQVDGLGRRGLVAGDDGRHRVADKPHLVRAEGVLVVADRQDAVGDWKTVAGQDEVNAGMRRRARSVDADDTRVRDRRPEQFAVHHARQHHVVGKPRLPGDLRAAVHATPCLADHAAHRAPPAARAAPIAPARTCPHPSAPARTCPHPSARARTCPHPPAPARTCSAARSTASTICR